MANLVLIISLSAMTRKAIKDIVEKSGKYRAILQDETHKGAVEVNLRSPRAVILDGQMRVSRDPIAFVRTLKRMKPEMPLIFFDEYAHVCLEAKRAGAVRTMARPRLDDAGWMSWWGAELVGTLETEIK